MWSNQENRVRKQVKNLCETARYAIHSSGKNSLAVGLSPYKIAKKDAFASKLAGRLFSPFCMACSVHKFLRHKFVGLQILVAKKRLNEKVTATMYQYG